MTQPLGSSPVETVAHAASAVSVVSATTAVNAAHALQMRKTNLPPLQRRSILSTPRR